MPPQFNNCRIIQIANATSYHSSYIVMVKVLAAKNTLISGLFSTYVTKMRKNNFFWVKENILLTFKYYLKLSLNVYIFFSYILKIAYYMKLVNATQLFCLCFKISYLERFMNVGKITCVCWRWVLYPWERI